jgi:prephenate dehydrogenase
MQLHTLTIVGVGLIGGSLGLAAKKRGLAQRVHGVGRDLQKLHLAQKLGAIDSFSADAVEGVKDASLVVYCTPVNRIVEQILAARDQFSPGTIITDAGSTKASIVQSLAELRRDDVAFVGSHPLAGSEKQGVEHGRADLFVNRWTILTPTAATSAPALEQVRSFWHAVGARTKIMSPEEHDRALALTSHLPHLLAAALAGILPAEWANLTATGFRDTTRVAAGDPGVWTPIFLHNHTAVLVALDHLEARLQAFRSALGEQDAARIDELLAQGKKVRDAL